MRIISLRHYPEETRNSSKYDNGISLFFSEKMTFIFNEVFEQLSNHRMEQKILINEEGNIPMDFLKTVMDWINISYVYKDEFHSYFLLWIQEQM
jgi:hypothetical protein